tara:strand:+ start:1030 stop:2175 length:1146 start_codon:yes stop_codon:yes gene_type:complete
MKVVHGNGGDWVNNYNALLDSPQAEQEPLFTSADTLKERELVPLNWLINSMIPSGTVTLLSGDGGSGKSLLALNLAISVASGGKLKWLNYTPEQGSALYIGAEDDMNEIHRRINRMTMNNFDLAYADLADLHIASLANRDALLSIVDPKTNTLYPSPLYQQIVTKVDAERPSLVVLDTLADLFPANENDRASARQFIGQLRKMAVDFDTTVVLLSHPSLSGMASGSGTSGNTAWSNSVRSRLYMQRIQEDGYEADKTARKLTVMKSNYGETGIEILMNYNDGYFEADKTTDSLDRVAMDAKADRVFLRLLEAHTAASVKLSPNYTSNNSAATVFSRSDDRESVTKKQFMAAQERLILRKEIKIEEEGSPSRRVKYIRKVGA